MPAGLAGMGFAGIADLWMPWCAAHRDGTVASVAFAARLSPTGAELGVATAPEARGHGLAAAVTATWSAHPDLAGRARFFTTAVENHSSRRVAERLGLRLLGPTISVP
jgi:predicted GNAT family acetyltransferase